MLDPAKRPSWSDQSQATVRSPAPELRSAGPPDADRAASAISARGRVLVQPRIVAAVMLIAAGIVWAAIRGLQFYGVSPVHVVYDLDQPPILLVAVAMWLLYRSRRR